MMLIQARIGESGIRRQRTAISWPGRRNRASSGVGLASRRRRGPEGSRYMQFRRLLLALALIVAGPLPARAEAPAAKDVAAVGDCLRKQDRKRGSQEADEAAWLMTVAQ